MTDPRVRKDCADIRIRIHTSDEDEEWEDSDEYEEYEEEECEVEVVHKKLLPEPVPESERWKTEENIMAFANLAAAATAVIIYVIVFWVILKYIW